MDKLRRVLSGREDNEELGLTAQVSFSLVCCELAVVVCLSLLNSRAGEAD